MDLKKNMRLVFYVEARYTRDDDGVIYNTEGVMKFPLWDRYLEVFDEIILVARVQHVPGFIGKKSDIANGDKVSFVELPYFHGPIDFLKKRKSVMSKIEKSTSLSGAFLLRVPGQIGTLAAGCLNKIGKSFGIEVVGDPYDVFSKGAVKHPLRLLFKYKYYRDLKRVVSHASASLYVTENTLQKRYPPKDGAFSTFASNVILKDDNLIRTSRKRGYSGRSFNLISIGSLEQMYKAPDVLLKSIQLINNNHNNQYQVFLTWIGAGKHLGEMQELASSLGIEQYVNFLGYLSNRQEIQHNLDSADAFVLASRTEGLPRVVVEAMARALPVIATRVGGVPELISDQFLVEKDDPIGLASKILSLIDDPELFEDASKMNLQKASEFLESILSARRRLFYQSLLQIN